jgi:hypothetical protein
MESNTLYRNTTQHNKEQTSESEKEFRTCLVGRVLVEFVLPRNYNIEASIFPFEERFLLLSH